MSVQMQPATAASATDLSARVGCEGSASHPYLTAPALDRGRYATANLADLVHHLGLLHGRNPGMADLALERAPLGPATAWLEEAAAAFSDERTLLAGITTAAGPVPSTPGQAATEATVTGQHHALETLATSTRTGCGIGAVAALVLDWYAIRTLLDRAAERLGVRAERCRLPAAKTVLDGLALASVSPGIERAAAFGAQQLLAQHRGLWDLLEARTAARDPG